MKRTAELRAADVDRQTIADRLRVAVHEGRPELAEYDQRRLQAYAARAYRELDALVADLPCRSSLLAAAAGRPACSLLSTPDSAVSLPASSTRCRISAAS